MRSLGMRMRMKTGRLPMAPALVLATALACSLPVMGGAQERPTLTPDDAPDWISAGVPYLQQKDRLRPRRPVG
jgi:hypothetical protein